MKLENLYKTLRAHLSESDARYVLKKRAGIDHTALISSPERVLESAITEAIQSDLKRLESGMPLSRLYGEREFWGMVFKLSPETLDPRPDTETLIEAALAHYKGKEPPRSILDLGTGTGCILVSLLSEFPDARGTGVDLSAQAVGTAQRNAQENQVGDRAEFLEGSWLAPVHESFDLVVSNPPYIRESVVPALDESVKNHDPILALDGGEDGLQAYKDIFSNLSRVLNLGGRAFFEIGFDQEESVTRLSEESRFLVEATHADLAGHIRVLELTHENSSGDK